MLNGPPFVPMSAPAVKKPIPARVVLAAPPVPTERQMRSKSIIAGPRVVAATVTAAVDHATPAADQVVEVRRRTVNVNVGVAVAPIRYNPRTLSDLPVP